MITLGEGFSLAFFAVLVAVVLVWMFHSAGFRRSAFLTRFEERRPWAAFLMNVASPSKRNELVPSAFPRTQRVLEIVLKVVVGVVGIALVACLVTFALFVIEN